MKITIVVALLLSGCTIVVVNAHDNTFAGLTASGDNTRHE